VCAKKGCWLKDLKNVSVEELEIQFQLLLESDAEEAARG
jgi:hypothetical protein